MSSSELTAKLDNWSDRLSPMVVKEVRQMVRGREFSYSFLLALVAGLLVAFIGLASAGNVTGGAGRPIFSALMVCLIMLGLVVVPLGAFNALRTERSDHTLDLITQTSLTPRRIVLGKLLTQGVKLVTLFAGLAPFVAMSFLLGGVDLLTILVGLALLFLWSMWVCAVCLFVSAAAASRAVSGILFAVMTVGFFVLIGRFNYLWMPMLGMGGGFYSPATTASVWWTIAGTTAFCLISMANFVLLAENRLSHPVEDRSTALRVGFFIQFLFIVTVVVSPLLVHAAGYTTSDAAMSLGLLGGFQIALVSIFSTTEDMALSRRVIRNIKPSLGRPWAVFRPGGGRATAWVMLQMLVLLGVGLALSPGPDFRWLLGICSYICFFTGVPACAGRLFLKSSFKTTHLRVATFVFIPVVILSADVLQYFLKSKSLFSLDYSPYHVLNPFRTLSNWTGIENLGWDLPVFVMGLIGLLCYVLLIRIGQHETRNASALHTSN